MNASVKRLSCQRGFSYLEVLIATAIIAVSAVPISTAFRQSLSEAEHSSRSTIRHFKLLEKMEEVMSNPYPELSLAAAGSATATAYSDANGSTDRRLVYIAAYDGDDADLDSDGFTGTDSDLLWIRVVIENEARDLQVLRSRQ